MNVNNSFPMSRLKGASIHALWSILTMATQHIRAEENPDSFGPLPGLIDPGIYSTSERNNIEPCNNDTGWHTDIL